MNGRELWRALVLRVCTKIMAQWLYSEAGNLNLPDPYLPLKVKTESLGPIIGAFISNAKRLHEFWRFAPHLIETATGHVLGIVNAIFAVTGRPSLNEDQQKDKELHAKIMAKMAEELTELFEATGDIDFARRYNFPRALDNFEHLLEQDEHGEEALYALFCSQITLAWTAWETLATDLWEAALNCHPGALAKLAGRDNRISKLAQYKVSEDDVDTKREFEPQLKDFDRITKGTYNAANVMGTLLKKEFKFHTLLGIRQAYSSAFVDNSGHIDAALASNSLDRLNLVRNLITHKAGIVDYTFADRVSVISDWKIEHEIGKPLCLDGALVKGLINPVFDLATSLIVAVDDWITPKRKKAGPLP